jgi:hypothetical protein
MIAVWRWVLLSCIGIGALLAGGESGYGWIANAIEKVAEAHLSKSVNAKFIGIGHVAEHVERSFAALYEANVPSVYGHWLSGHLIEKEDSERATATSDNWTWIARLAVLWEFPVDGRLWKVILCGRDKIGQDDIVDKGSGLAAISKGQDESHGLIWNEVAAGKINRLNGNERPFALDEGPCLKYADASQAEREGGNPPSKAHHPVWIAERPLSKPSERLLLLLATIFFGITAMVFLFGGHDSSVRSAVGIALFFGAPILLFVGLLWIG